MNFFSILTLLGGLTMFLYGMQVMGDGLAKVSGGKLEQILENLTSSKWKAVLLGMCVTAVIQSSSATTVMVVGFVNAGIMNLTQAMGVIMGDLLASELSMHWVIYEDRLGRSRALRYQQTDHYLFPMTMISRRLEVDNRSTVAAIYQRAVDLIKPQLAKRPFQ